MIVKPWSHLPNAQLIDWVIESVESNPDVWINAPATTQHLTNPKVRNVAWAMARIATKNRIRAMAYNPTSDLSIRIGTAWDAILALVAYDDCDQCLNMTYEQLRVYAAISDKPQALLLLPMKWIQEHESLVTPT